MTATIVDKLPHLLTTEFSHLIYFETDNYEKAITLPNLVTY